MQEGYIKIGKDILNTYPIKSVNMRGLISNIYIIDMKITHCPFCKMHIQEEPYVLAVAISDTHCVKISGQACTKCNAIFTTERSLVKKISTICKKKESFILHEEYRLCNEKSYYDEMFNKLESARYQVFMLAENKSQVYTIVQKKREVDHEKNIIHFSEDKALDILTAIYLEKQSVVIDGTDYFIGLISDKESKNILYFLAPDKSITVSDIASMRGGGYYSNSNSIEYVYGLVFAKKVNALSFCHFLI